MMETINTKKLPVKEIPIENVKEKLGIRHLQVLLMTLSLMIGYAINLSLSVALIAMTDPKNELLNFKYYDWTTAQTSLILSSYLWGYAALQIPSSYISKVWSAQKLFSLGLFISSFINILLPLFMVYGDWIALCSGRVVIGLCHACFSSCTHNLLSKWAPPAERARMSTFVTTGSVLGSVLAMSVSGLIAASTLGWPGIFYIFGGLGLVLSIIVFFNVADSPSVHAGISPSEKLFILNSFEQVKNHCETVNTNTPWTKILTSVPVWALIITECGSNWGTWTINTQMPIYMKNILNFDIKANGLISTLPYLANWLLSFPFSWISDYALRKDISISRIRRFSNTVGMWGSAAALVAFCLIKTDSKIWPVILLILAVGLKAGTASGYIVNQIDLSPNFCGTIYSTTTCLGTVVSMLAPIASGEIVKDQTNINQWHEVFYLTALIYFITNFIYIIFGRGKIRSWNNPEVKTPIQTIYDPQTIVTRP